MDSYVSLEVFLAYGFYTGADLDRFRIDADEAGRFRLLDAYSVTGRIAAIPGGGPADIAMAVQLVLSAPLTADIMRCLSEDLLLFFNTHAKILLSEKRGALPKGPVPVPLEIEVISEGKDALLLTIEADEECFSQTAGRLELLMDRAEKNCLKEISLYREDGAWKLAGSTRVEDSMED